MYDVIIIGSGPSGLTAGIYTARAALKTLIIAGEKWGGQLMQTSEVENYPGFVEGILGPELMMRMRKQAERFNVEIIDRNATELNVDTRPFSVSLGDEIRQAKAVIIATGADTMWLGVPGEKQFIGRGISSCAPCDAFFYKDKNVMVVGGGDSAMEEALVLTKFAKQVTIIHRRDSFKASKIMQDRVLAHAKISVLWNSEIVEITGDKVVTGVKVKTIGVEAGQAPSIQDMPIDGVFVAIGHVPNSMIFKGKIDLDEKGYVKRHTDTTYTSLTSVEGIFVAGDIHDHHYRQAITAAGFGCQSALDVERWLDNTK